VITVAFIDGIDIVIAMLAGAAIGLLVAVARYQGVETRQERYEQEIVRDTERCARAHAILQRHNPAERNDNRKSP
jgi:hypothetical protein